MGSHSFKVNAMSMFHGIAIIANATKLFNGNC
jgi:hypothetical protein